METQFETLGRQSAIDPEEKKLIGSFFENSKKLFDRINFYKCYEDSAFLHEDMTEKINITGDKETMLFKVLVIATELECMSKEKRLNITLSEEDKDDEIFNQLRNKLPKGEEQSQNIVFCVIESVLKNRYDRRRIDGVVIQFITKKIRHN